MPPLHRGALVGVPPPVPTADAPTILARRLVPRFPLALLLAGALAGTSRATAQPAVTRDTAVFAGGCFWCMEEAFEAVPGVVDVRSGYIGGTVPDPTYAQVSAGRTGHYEAIEVVFDPARVSYARLVDRFWRNVDPEDATGQFCDKGDQYRAAIFPRDERQRQVATASKAALDASKRFPRPVAVRIVPATRFYPAESYHQDYHSRNPVRYTFYKRSCGRARRLEAVWGSTTARALPPATPARP